jgi:hypothetical protein
MVTVQQWRKWLATTCSLHERTHGEEGKLVEHSQDNASMSQTLCMHDFLSAYVGA